MMFNAVLGDISLITSTNVVGGTRVVLGWNLPLSTGSCLNLRFATGVEASMTWSHRLLGERLLGHCAALSRWPTYHIKNVTFFVSVFSFITLNIFLKGLGRGGAWSRPLALGQRNDPGVFHKCAPAHPDFLSGLATCGWFVSFPGYVSCNAAGSRCIQEYTGICRNNLQYGVWIYGDSLVLITVQGNQGWNIRKTICMNDCGFTPHRQYFITAWRNPLFIGQQRSRILQIYSRILQTRSNVSAL